MPVPRPFCLFTLVSLLMLATLAAFGQSVIATVPVGKTPLGVAVNSATGKVYVTNQGSNTVSVIDEGTSTVTATITVGSEPMAVAINQLTNKIYVANSIGNSVTVIDGASNGTVTLSVGTTPIALAVNPVTNQIYVVNWDGGTVTVIDGATNGATTISVGSKPIALAINSLTNRIYVANSNSNTVTVIDGATGFTKTLGAGTYPIAVAVNQLTNQIYVANNGSGNLTVIDGASNNLTTVTAANAPSGVAVNSITNKIYVPNSQASSVTVIDGVNLSTAFALVAGTPDQAVIDPVTNTIYITNHTGAVDYLNGSTLTVGAIQVSNYTSALDLDSTTNRIYVPNPGSNTVSVIAGAPPPALHFTAITPCRVVDTRNTNGPFGGPAITGGASRDFPIQKGACKITPSATAYSLNVTVVPRGRLGYLTVWPTGQNRPVVSTLNSVDGRVKANAAIVPAGANLSLSAYATDTTDVIFDINGYFVPAASDKTALEFHTLTPCRVVDTRGVKGNLGGPNLIAGATREFPILTQSNCNIPADALVYSLNFTVIPSVRLGYLTAWPSDQQKPAVSTLNATTGTVTANAAIVSNASSNGDISVYATDATALVIDINGYFAPPGNGGLSLYAGAPCRVLDTRKTTGAFNGTLAPPVNVVASPCGVPNTAKAFVLNATVVPLATLGYLALWPDSQKQPVVSTLNAIDGYITNNMAIVPAVNGSIDAFANGTTQLILDLFGYFAP